ncbi:Beta,beta-carotene 15,15'-monooxygenase [Halocaridina rubra]|uniref:Beta,beta-carotene 15,15'-monooxygenase n=1 Tax=Halocaridina rubra TaxID=373956 RepID=A0AAN9AG58_HALRR
MSDDYAHCIWLRDCKQETIEEIQGQVKGTIPEWLEGRVTRNGPGKLQVGDTQYNHLFDALAMLHQFNISRGEVTYRSRFLESDTYLRNMKANRIVVTEFGTAGYPDPCITLYQKFKNFFSIPSPDKSMSDNCLVSVCQVKDEMFALTENAFIRKFDPKTLKTLDKVLLTNYVAVNLATAHPHIGNGGNIYNMGSSITNISGPCYNVIEMPMGKIENAKVVATVPCLRRMSPSYFHSFGISENYWVLIEQPLVFRVSKIVRGTVLSNKPPSNALEWLPGEKTHFRVISRATGKLIPTRYTADSFVAFHHINMFEENGQLIMDLCGTEDGESLNMFYVNNLKKLPNDSTRVLFNTNMRRYILPLDGVIQASVGHNFIKRTDTSCTAVKQSDGSVHCTTQILYPEFFEVPRINYKRNGKSYRYAYGASTKGNDLIFERIVKVDVKTGQASVFTENEFTIAEPIFVAAPGAVEEDDGVILSTLLNKANPLYVALLVLNAKDMKELARVEFHTKGAVTPTFHGQYVAVGEIFHTY